MNWTEYNIETIKSKYLFKFLSEKYLLKFLETGNIWFARSDQFGDKMECVMIKDLLPAKPDFKAIERRKRKHLISCFHEGNKETLAFWDTYAKSDEERRKYAIRFNREYLTDLIENEGHLDEDLDNIKKKVHGKVKYKNLIGANELKLESKLVKYPAFRKEYVFAYEREYRFDLLLKSEYDQLGFNFYIGKPKLINFDIFVNPLLENKDYTKCLKVIRDSDFESCFKQSTLAKWLKPELWK